MAHVSSDGEEEDPNDIVSSHSLMAETITSPPLLPTLPFDVLPEILCRLPVKLLVQLRCLCKFFNSLISDPKFAKKHLRISTKCHHLMLTDDDESVMYDSPIPSFFSTSTVVTQTQLYPPITLTNGSKYVVVLCSCDGIFCCYLEHNSYYFLWNPSVRKFKLLPPLEIPLEGVFLRTSFGYDHFIDNYKVIVVSSENEVCVYTLGTDYWTRIQDIPYSARIHEDGVFVSGTVNWFAWDVILSLDLENESCQKLCLPAFKNENKWWWTLGVVRDCLCVIETSDMFLDVWIMKEYGNNESWTKLYTIPKLQVVGFKAYDALYVSKDDQLLVQSYEIESREKKLCVYDSKTGTLNILEFQNNYEQMNQKVYIESLISP